VVNEGGWGLKGLGCLAETGCLEMPSLVTCINKDKYNTVHLLYHEYL